MADRRRPGVTQGTNTITMSYRRSFAKQRPNIDGTRSMRHNLSGRTVSLTQTHPSSVLSSTVNITRKEGNREASSPSATSSQDESIRTPSPLYLDETIRSPSPLSDDESILSPSPSSLDESIRTPSPLYLDATIRFPSPLSDDESVRSPSPLYQDEAIRSPSPLSDDESILSPSPSSLDESIRTPSPLYQDETIRSPSPLSDDESILSPSPSSLDESIRTPSPLYLDETIRSPSPLSDDESVRSPSPLYQDEAIRSPSPSSQDQSIRAPPPSPQNESEIERNLLVQNAETDPIGQHARFVTIWGTGPGRNHAVQQPQGHQTHLQHYARSMDMSRPIPYPSRSRPHNATSPAPPQWPGNLLAPMNSMMPVEDFRGSSSESLEEGSYPSALRGQDLMSVYIPPRNGAGGVHLASFVNDPMGRVFHIQQGTGGTIMLIPIQADLHLQARLGDSSGGPGPGASRDVIEHNTDCFLYYTVPVPNRKTGVPDEDNQKCPICLCDLGYGTYVRRLPCKHLFHKECIEQWLLRCKTCALCRTDITIGTTHSR